MTWEYRVMNRDGELAIYEVHYGEDGSVQGYSANPSYPAADDLAELQLNCELYLAALHKPILSHNG